MTLLNWISANLAGAFWLGVFILIALTIFCHFIIQSIRAITGKYPVRYNTYDNQADHDTYDDSPERKADDDESIVSN